MRYRTTTLMALRSLGTAGTHIIDIPITDIISAFRFHLQVQRGAGAQLTHGFDAVSKIEVINGSDVLMELSMAQMEAIHFFERGQLGNSTVAEVSEHLDDFETAVYFGRWPFDQELAFNPKMFSNPQLRITFNRNTFDTTSTDLLMEVEAEVFDELVPAPIGFLQMREFYRYSQPAAAGYTYLNLPTDLVLRKLIVQPHCYTRVPQSIMLAARLDEDNMKRIPFDISTASWLAMNKQEYGDAEHVIAMTRQGAAQPLYNAVAELVAALWQEVGAPALQLIGVNGCQLTCTDGGTETTTAIGRIIGSAPHFCYCYPFGYQKDLNDWYETKDIGTLRLRLQNAVALGAPYVQTTRVILQQMRRY